MSASGLNERHWPALDGIRAIAIAGVFALHLDQAYFPGGAFGVDVFFVLSGFLITGILLKEFQETGRVQFKAFYWRRVFRLAPALILWLAVIAPVTAYKDGVASTIPWSTAGALFYFNDFLEAFTHLAGKPYGQSWSLAVEEQFYLIWPFLLVWGSRGLAPTGRRRAMFALVAVSIVVLFGADNYFLPTGHLVALMLGCWAATYQFRLSKGHHAPSRLLKQPIIGPACCAVFVAATFTTQYGTRGHLLVLLIDVASTVLLLHCIAAPAAFVPRVLATAVPRWIGVRSYGIYLYGLTLLQLIGPVTHLKLHSAAPLAVVLTGVVVTLSYRLVEAPIRRRGRMWLAARDKERVSV